MKVPPFFRARCPYWGIYGILNSIFIAILCCRYECNCTDTGYFGTHCELNIDDCQPNPCVHQEECTDGVKVSTGGGGVTRDCGGGGTGWDRLNPTHVSVGKSVQTWSRSA